MPAGRAAFPACSVDGDCRVPPATVANSRMGGIRFPEGSVAMKTLVKLAIAAKGMYAYDCALCSKYSTAQCGAPQVRT